MNTLRQLIDFHRKMADQACERAESYLRASSKTARQYRAGDPQMIPARMTQLAEHALKDALDHAEAFVVLLRVERAGVHG